MEEEIIAYPRPEHVTGTIQCQCGYWNSMDGFIDAVNDKYIMFKCPECEALVQVKNPDARG